MRLTKSTDILRGQVSLESIIIWAALMGILSLLLPVFSHAMGAQKGLVEKYSVAQFSDELSRALESSAFYAPGSVSRVMVPSITNLEIKINMQSVAIEWSPSTPTSTFSKTINSLLPLEGSVPSHSRVVWIERLENSIRVESE